MRIVVVHFHLRPGGVRRVIELATPPLLCHAPQRALEVVLASGEAPDTKWLSHFQQRTAPTPVRVFVEPTFGYLSEQGVAPTKTKHRLKAGLNALLNDGDPSDTVVWAHNLAIGRNLLLAKELTRACAGRNIRLVIHHHDWWFDQRWKRWPEMQRCGIRQVDQVAAAVLPDSSSVRHAAINQADAAPLMRSFGPHAAWIPNLSEPWPRPTEAQCRKTRDWLRRNLKLGARPVWLLPCRLLRRKNIAEALLLTRWLRPAAWLVTTGGVTSEDERSYATRLASAARTHHWRLRLGVLSGDESHKPTVPELQAVSECLLLTSIQEGFGLPYLEAAAARRPIIARSLPNVSPDLRRFGFRFPHNYEDILVKTDLFDWASERRRQLRLFAQWRKQLPVNLAKEVNPPAWCISAATPRAVPFSRLTLSAQIEVLAVPLESSWSQCAPLNPFLQDWRERATTGALQLTPWPRNAQRWLSGKVWARRFWSLASELPLLAPRSRTGVQAQRDLLRGRLAGANRHPLLYSTSITP